MKYETIKKFTKSVNKSRSSIYRFYVKRPDLFTETKLQNRKRLIPESHLKYFDIEIMHDEYNQVCNENKSMRNLIDGLMDKDSLCKELWYMPWSYFVTISYKLDRDQKSCSRLIRALNDDLVERYPETTIRMFFTTETYNNRNGHHNHLALYVGDESLHLDVIQDILQFFSFDRVDYGKYDPFKAGLFYMSKDGLVNEDWDLFGNDIELKIKNENTSHTTTV
ncbi:hypothetical protein [Psychroserpens ponticola]|uniref:Inovirus Gp2 family protein n=1 Tax=Psychroserpens ponticola TaxID=2932268 RepID=A0ABY7S0R8_9FLAO|nr:hypothetical protein [Psychroserpens ponticola]WCO02749.1 hypothetical protein MUN68_004445 [Psychroserpens ponticola]